MQAQNMACMRFGIELLVYLSFDARRVSQPSNELSRALLSALRSVPSPPSTIAEFPSFQAQTLAFRP